jgi:soluble lytic murein transglycosylase
MDQCADSNARLQQQPVLLSALTNILLATIIFIALAHNVQASPSTTGGSQGPSLDDQRELYQEAKRALKVGNQTHFQHTLTQMGDYPLKHYLEAMALFERLNSYPRHDVRTFLSQHEGSPIARMLRYRWLEALRKRDRWQDYLADYNANTATTAQQCYYQLALIRSGEKTQPIAAALKLWAVGKSQPKGCDKLFGVLIKNHHITEAVAWQRYTDAIFNHEYQLARYLQRFFTTPNYQELADKFYRIDRNHRVVGDYQFFNEHYVKTNSEEIHNVVTHGLSHLAYVDAVTALKHWGRYRHIYLFNPSQQKRIVTAIIKGLYAQDRAASADIYLTDNLDFVDTSLLEWRAREAMRKANWQEVLLWISHMPKELQQDDRWKYWTYRAQQLATATESNTPPSKTTDTVNTDTYKMLSIDRSFYGFISSEWLGNDYSMAHRGTSVLPEQITELETRPGLTRTRELLHQKEYLYAHREWRQATRNFSESQWITAAHLSRQWQWYNGTVTSMIRAGYWDDINLRFPLAFKESFEENARQTEVPLHLLFAVARQESALSHDVTSPAGAKGLMQLMPGTAKQTARKNNIRYHNSNDLFKPNINIALGSRYYKEMLERFDNNRILATAAYNAGPHRVDRWQKETEGKLPFDAWIETIPYKETRNYVQNVLAFSIIYAHHLGNHERILSAQEKNRQL